ncbi:MAG: hypothetical protein WAV55_07610 [Clostridiaceae bacterium]
MMVEYFYSRLSCPDLYFLSQVIKWNGVEFTLVDDVAIRLDVGFSPLS